MRKYRGHNDSEEAPMAKIASETFTKVSERTKQAGANIESADAKRHVHLQDRVTKAHERAAKRAARPGI
jgi:hypothetical protein